MNILDQEEKIISTFRKHNFYIILEIFFFIILGGLPAFLFLFTKMIKIESGSDILSLYVFLYFIFVSLLWLVCFYSWTNYYLDIWILTDKRLVSVDQKGFFSREVSSIRLDKIQDINIETRGLLNTILHIGTIKVQSAGTDREFVMYGMRNPTKVKDIIFKAQSRQIDAIKTVRIAK
ncbi:MAG TPA: PH domain-containing protein [Candidatus Paceibacterota bacterium]|nr:PH domain-containing protein [Candidatus Paceibacterota bacterium]